jgi:hypothetical protein
MKHHVCNQEQRAFILDNLQLTAKDLASLFTQRFGISRTDKHIKGFLANNKIKTGKTGRFKKGNVPYNTGTKGLKKGSSTSFRHGNRPHNWKPVGSERVSKDGYIEVKIAEPHKWKAKHVLIWERGNGPVPKGCAIIFGDRDTRNFSPGNLIKVTRSELLFLNRKRLLQRDADLTRAAVNVAKVAVKIYERVKAQ